MERSFERNGLPGESEDGGQDEVGLLLFLQNPSLDADILSIFFALFSVIFVYTCSRWTLKNEYISRWENDILMLGVHEWDQGETDGQDMFTLLGELADDDSAEHRRGIDF